MSSITIPWTVACGLLLLALGAMSISFLRKKHRLIWKYIFSFQEELERVQDRHLELAKEVCLLGLSDLRLPARMPSQHGEDVLLWNFFSGKRTGFYVDVGAYDGVCLSNTYFFEAIGWRGVLVEPNPAVYEACRRARPSSECVQAAVVGTPGNSDIMFAAVQGEGGLDTLSFTSASPEHLERIRVAAGNIVMVPVPARSMEQILATVDTPIDFISIDVEGGELEVLKGLDFDRHAPRCFVIEDNTGGRDRRVPEYLATKGYYSRHRHGGNAFFAKPNDPGTFAL